jgi:ribose transport system substrate-binding protein
MTRLVISRYINESRLRQGRPGLLAAGAVAAAVLVAACGSSASSSSSVGPVSSPSTAGDTPVGLAYAQAQVSKYRAAVASYPSPGPDLDASKVAALKGKTILFVPISAGAGPFIQQQAALESALSRLGIKVVTCDPKFVPTAAATCMDNAPAYGAAAVVTSGIPYSIASIAYRNLEQRDIPTLAANSGPGNPANTRTVAYMALDQPTDEQGMLQADEVIAQSGGHGQILYVYGDDSPVLQALAAVTQGEFRKHCAGCTVVPAGISTANLNQLPSLVSSKLISDPGTAYIAIQADPFVPLVLSGVQSANFTAKVKGIGQTAETSVLQMIQEGQFVISDVGVDSSYEGWVEADGILRMLTGQPSNPEPFVPIRIFDAENLKGLNVSASADIDALFGSLTFKDMFYKTWGVG